MRSKFTPACNYALAFYLLVAGACSSGGGDDDAGNPIISSDPVIQQLAICTGLGVRDYDALALAYLHLIDTINSPSSPAPGISYDPTTGAIEINLDVAHDGAVDTVLTGSVKATVGSLVDGFQKGEVIILDWTATGFLVGSSKIRLQHNGDSHIVGGEGSFADPTGCVFESSDLNFSIWWIQPGTLAAHGSLMFEARKGPDVMTGRIIFTVDEDAQVDAEFAGEPIQFFIDVETFKPYIE